MNWQRIQDAATPMELAPRRDERLSHSAETVRTALTVAMVVPYLWLAPGSTVEPTVVYSMPVPSAFEDCRLQNLEHPALLARCDDLIEEAP